MTLDREKIAERNKIKEFCRNWAGECQVPCGYCWNEPEPLAAPVAAEVLERARRLAAETPPHPASGTNNCERHEFARALLAEHARAEAAERERDEAVLKQLTAENSLHNQEIIARGDKEAWRTAILADRAAREAAEGSNARMREQRDLQQRARIAAERERDILYEHSRKVTVAYGTAVARAEAAEATVARLREALADMRCKLHAANRPVLRNGLRLELRDQIDAAISAPAAPEVSDGR